VRVLSVEMRDFRSYARASARLGAGLTVIHGPNGAGKSNLLEALYYGCTARSPRTRNDRELIRFGAPATRVSVRLHDGEHEHELTVAYGAGEQGTRAEKRLTADGAPVERLLDVPARPLVSVFQPDRLELVKGPPALRRSHLDQFVAALWPARAQTRSEYARVLAQRNALIARVRTGRGSRAALETWDRELARTGLALMADRAAAAALLAEPFARRAGELGLLGTAALAAGRPTSSSSWRSWASASPPIWSAASRGTGRTATSWRCSVTAASCAPTAPRASSGSRCWLSCWPSARCWRASGGAHP
jgi:DNA replication and repair protein RecF